MEDGPLDNENHPAPISEFELRAALMIVGGRFPNARFIIEKYIEQIKAYVEIKAIPEEE